jgi:glycosyltransferase involved in cell wall biosynthesis
MNLLFIQKSTGRGGAKNSLTESLRAITAQPDLHPHVIVGEPGPFLDRCAHLHLPTTLAPLPEWRKLLDRLRFPSAIKSLATTLSNTRPDWIISNEMWWGPHAAHLARHLHCRSAVILRDGIATIKKSHQYRLYQNDLILPVSSTIADALTADPTLAPRVHVLFNSVSLPPANPADAATLHNLLEPFPLVQRWLLIVGKLSSRKNQADAVRTLRALIDDGHTDLGLLLAGDIDPDYRPEMDATIAQTRLADRVAMIGNFDGLTSLLEKAHTVLLPSFREGLPRSLVESITAAKPAFSYPCEGVDDIYGTHRTTFVSHESTSPSLTETIRRAWSDPAATQAAFQNVRTQVLARFSPEAHLARLRSLLTAPTRTPSR